MDGANRSNIPVDQRINYFNHLRNLSAKQVDRRAALVWGSTVSGWTSGTVIGAVAAGPFGVVPGMAIGASVGFVAGVAGYTAKDASDYLSFRESVSQEIRQNMDEPLIAMGISPEDDICPITQSIPVDPVYIEGEKQIYERAALLAIPIREGVRVSPITRKPFTEDEVKKSAAHKAKVGRYCDLLLNNADSRAQMTPMQIKGAALLRDEIIKNTEKQYETKVKDLLADVKAKRISPQQMVLEMQQLADLIDPVISKEANASRVMVDHRKIAIPPEALARNANEENKVPDLDDV